MLEIGQAIYRRQYIGPWLLDLERGVAVAAESTRRSGNVFADIGLSQRDAAERMGISAAQAIALGVPARF